MSTVLASKRLTYSTLKQYFTAGGTTRLFCSTNQTPSSDGDGVEKGKKSKRPEKIQGSAEVAKLLAALNIPRKIVASASAARPEEKKTLRLEDTKGSVKTPSLVEQYKQSAMEQDKPVTRHPVCRTLETNPWRHTEQHEGLFYTISSDDYQRWFKKGLMPHVYRMFKAFGEQALMVRRPAVEVISCLHNSNMKAPVVRYVLHGRPGSGKTTSLAHVMHACGHEGWLVLQLPWVGYYIQNARDMEYSTFKPGRINQPMASAEWLAEFRSMNKAVLEKFQPRTVNRYVWAKRESTEVGSLWTDAIDYALTRPRYASDVVGLITKEVRTSAEMRQFPVLVAIDGVNSFWQKTAFQHEVDKTKYHYPSEVTMLRGFMKLLKNDWSNGAVVTSVDANAIHDMTQRTSHLPQQLLGKEAYDLFDPYIPIHVPDYTDKETHSCLEYYSEKKWLVAPQSQSRKGRQEMIFLSSRNPLALYKVSRHW